MKQINLDFKETRLDLELRDAFTGAFEENNLITLSVDNFSNQTNTKFSSVFISDYQTFSDKVVVTFQMSPYCEIENKSWDEYDRHKRGQKKEWKEGDIIEAKFSPRFPGSLPPEVKMFVDKRIKFAYVFEFTGEANGSYYGQPAFEILGENNLGFWPLQDLREIKDV